MPQAPIPTAAQVAAAPQEIVAPSIAYDDADLREAESAGATYVAVGAIYPTATKKIGVVGPIEVTS